MLLLVFRGLQNVTPPYPALPNVPPTATLALLFWPCPNLYLSCRTYQCCPTCKNVLIYLDSFAQIVLIEVIILNSTS